MYTDANGLLMVKQVDGSLDGGDSCSNTARALIGGLTQFAIPLAKCEISPGQIVRNPTDANWNKPNQTSRDQVKPFIWAINPYKANIVSNVELFNSWGYFWIKINSDFMTKLVFLRLKRTWYSKWFTNYLMDIGTLISVIIDCFHTNPDDVGDTLNLTVDIRGSLDNDPTFVLQLAIKLWSKFKPKNNGNIIFHETHPVIGAWMWYYRPSTGNNPEIAEAWSDWIERNIK